MDAEPHVDGAIGRGAIQIVPTPRDLAVAVHVVQLTNDLIGEQSYAAAVAACYQHNEATARIRVIAALRELRRQHHELIMAAAHETDI